MLLIPRLRASSAARRPTHARLGSDRDPDRFRRRRTSSGRRLPASQDPGKLARRPLSTGRDQRPGHRTPPRGGRPPKPDCHRSCGRHLREPDDRSSARDPLLQQAAPNFGASGFSVGSTCLERAVRRHDAVMRDTELYRQLLGLEAPWEVSRVELSVEGGRVDVWVDHPRGTRWPCPECERDAPRPTTTPRSERGVTSIRCQFLTYLHARPPRVECPEHGVRQRPPALGRADDRASPCSSSAWPSTC